jgi:hypothetical protein
MEENKDAIVQSSYTNVLRAHAWWAVVLPARAGMRQAGSPKRMQRGSFHPKHSEIDISTPLIPHMQRGHSSPLAMLGLVSRDLRVYVTILSHVFHPHTHDIDFRSLELRSFPPLFSVTRADNRPLVLPGSTLTGPFKQSAGVQAQ